MQTILDRKVITRVYPEGLYCSFSLTGEWRKLNNEDLNDLYPLPSIVRVMT